MCLDARDDLTYLTADLHLAAQQLLGLGHCLTGNDLTYLELHFCEVVIFDLCLRLNIDGFLLCLFCLGICLFRFMLRCCLDHGFFQLCLFFCYILHIQTGEEANCQTRLLGEHSISNLLLCCTAARALGMTLPEIALGVSHCQPVEHRLELLDGGAGVSIIDDAFNANPVGAQCALRVIKAFPGRRIIITPGMVELGGKEDEFNRTFGKQMADSVDIAILVGRKHTQPIVEGLKEAGFPQENTYVVGSLEESTTLLHSMMRAGDVVLYENDLPDNYSE